MIILDTNVVSELMKPTPDSSVANWFSQQERGELKVTSITQGELLSGALRLTPGPRRNEVLRSIEQVLSLFSGESLPFNSEAANHYGSIMAHRESIGRSLDRNRLDGQIAAIASANNAAVATRNVPDFTDCGVEIINHWETSANQ